MTVRAQCFDTLYRRRDGQLEPDLRYLAHGLRLDTIGVDGLPRYSMRLRDDLRGWIRLAAKLQPDLVLMDLTMPKKGGVQAIEEIKRASPKVRVLVLTMHDDQAYLRSVLAAGGDLPADMPFGAVVRAVIDPVAAVQRLDGTPLLMVHGRRDRTVTPEQARRLFEAARDPKEIRWWDAGHYLPAPAIGEAAAWLAEKLAVSGRRRTG